mmetsp:Transcript_22870/g.42346  ORF Transcript_22870/g.42346 Transcript_22870/m.42346 type:complete len:108 (+) Transcript_22870:913-1236(+)
MDFIHNAFGGTLWTGNWVDLVLCACLRTCTCSNDRCSSGKSLAVEAIPPCVKVARSPTAGKINGAAKDRRSLETRASMGDAMCCDEADTNTMAQLTLFTTCISTVSG